MYLPLKQSWITLSNGRPPAALGGEGPFVAGFLTFDHPALFVSRGGDAAAHVRHNQPQVCVFSPLLARIALGHGLGIQHVPAAMAFDQRGTGDARLVGPLVHADGIDDKGLGPGFARDLPGQKRTQVRSVIAIARQAQVAQHLFVHAVGAAGQTAHQSSTPDHCIELTDVIVVGGQLALNRGQAEIELVEDTPAG